MDATASKHFMEVHFFVSCNNPKCHLKRKKIPIAEWQNYEGSLNQFNKVTDFGLKIDLGPY